MVINRTELAPLRERINCGQTRTESEEVEKTGQKNKKTKIGERKIVKSTRSRYHMQGNTLQIEYPETL